MEFAVFLSTSSISPPMDCLTNFPPDHKIFKATAIATIGSKGSQPVNHVSNNPPTTPKLVHESVRTCLPLAMRIIEFVFFPFQTMYPPRIRFITDAANVNKVP